MRRIPLKKINSNFFKKWSSDMAYVLGYIVADGCVGISKNRISNPFTLNITSIDKEHLEKIMKVFGAEHKISKKFGTNRKNIAYQIQLRNSVMTNDLIALGVVPRKTHNLQAIKISDVYFSDFTRGFFDGDGSVYIYEVNGTSQIKSSFVGASLPFFADFNKNLCRLLSIVPKNIHKNLNGLQKHTLYSNVFYIDDCERLYKFMYGNNPKLYLERKREIFEKWRDIKRRGYKKQNYPSKIGWRLGEKMAVQEGLDAIRLGKVSPAFDSARTAINFLRNF